ncbi:MAG: pilus assembly protein [Alphaproteobacteria bacterium]|nr:pilus assembly protein [Alphaproteobacteria bacterium]
MGHSAVPKRLNACLRGRLRRFFGGRGGNVATIFALSLVPLALAAGAGLDYARAVVVRSHMSQALDAAALAVGATNGLSQSSMQTLAQQYFDANYRLDSSYGTPSALSFPATGAQSFQITASDAMPTTLLTVIGIRTLQISTSTTVKWGQTKLWVALVLDNTGSMCQSDTYPNASSPCPSPYSGSKIAQLQSATHSLLTMLQGAAANAGDVQVAIIPFVKDVNAGTGNVNASWIDWTNWNATNGSCSGGSGSTQSLCTVAHCSKSWYTTKTTCQSAHGTWYNAGTWTPKNHSTWTGCVMDRGTNSGPDASYNYDVMNTSPVSGSASSLFPAEQYSNCPQSLMGLSYDWTALDNKVDAMVAGGSTNQTIGLVWGWHALSQGDPLDAAALPANTTRYIIILSDGVNTQDRWYGNGSTQSTQVDARMSAVCSNAKAGGVVIYAVFVDIGGTQGNSSVLQSCATDSSKYFDLTSADQIVSTFNAIGQQITNLHVAQ